MKVSANTTEFKLIPSGDQLAVCIGLYDIGTQMTFDNKLKRQIIIQWEMPNSLIEAPGKDVDGMPLAHSEYYTLSLWAPDPSKGPTPFKAAKLRTHLEGWRGRKFTKEELDSFDVKNVLGKACLLAVEHQEKDDGGLKAKVKAIKALPADCSPPKPINDLRYFSFDDCTTIDDNVAEWIRKKIMGSPEWKALKMGGQSPAEEAANTGTSNVTEPAEDDNLPF